MAKIFKVVVAIVSAIITATSQALNLFNIYPQIKWEFVTLIGSIIFIGLMFWLLVSAERRIGILEDNRPSIEVELCKNNDIYMLNIKNNGAQAIFKAQIKLHEGDPAVFDLSSKPFYQACWNNSEKCQATISNGLSAGIKIAELYASPPGFNSLTWRLFYCNNNNLENYASTSSYFVGAYYTNEDGSYKAPYKPCYKYKLHIIISASPGLRDGNFESDYVISYEEGMEQLIPNKRSYKKE